MFVKNLSRFCIEDLSTCTFQLNIQSEVLRVRTTIIERIVTGELDRYKNLKHLDIEANHRLTYIEPGSFRYLTKLEQMSISYNTALQYISNSTFEGLVNLHSLTLVGNGFTDINQLTFAFRPIFLPSLRALDLAENTFSTIKQHTFLPMRGTNLTKLYINLCRLDDIHPLSFLPLENLEILHVGENDLNSSLIGNFLMQMMAHNISLTSLDLSGMGFRKQPPKHLLKIIAKTTIKKLSLAQNQFEVIDDNAFPQMVNIELLDLRKVMTMSTGPNAFEPIKFPNLKVLLLGGNNLPGIHRKHLSSQLLCLDMSNNKGNLVTPVYYEIDRDTFIESTGLRYLNLAFNRIKSIHNYTFRGLEKIRIINLENGTIFYIGPGTFKPTKRLEVLNLANNPLSVNQNLTSVQFEGLNELKTLSLQNCGIKKFNDDDNIFEMMPSLTKLILKNNQLYYITAETLKPLQHLQILDLSENLLITWWNPLFLDAGVKPRQLLLTNNKISHFSISMIEDISYILESNENTSAVIDLMDNVFVCDCNSMYETYLWLQANGSIAIKTFFVSSNIQCSSPDIWEDRKVSQYLSSVKSLHCLIYHKISKIMLLVWTAPSLISIIALVVVVVCVYKYRIYLRYWLFLAKMAMGRKFIRKTLKAEISLNKTYKYDAFVSYCFDDRDFILEMITQLETNLPYLKLCVSERDFEVGSFISEAIVNCINESRYILLVISNNFAKSQWCRWETQLAEYHRLFLEDGTTYDPLVLVKIGDVDNKYLTPTLKYLLKTKIYLTWNEYNSDFFWKKLRTVLGKKNSY